MRESAQTTESGKAFNAILKASELIPYDSAIFLSTDNDPTDFEQFDRAATVLIKKRIRVSYFEIKIRKWNLILYYNSIALLDLVW